MKLNTIQVAIAIISKKIDVTPQFLLGFRKSTQHQGNKYEFIGGKVEENEQPIQALKRECAEEVGIHINNAEFLQTITHDYDDIRVCLHVYHVHDFTGEIKSMEGQLLQWVSSDTLQELPMPKANDTIKILCKSLYNN